MNPNYRGIAFLLSLGSLPLACTKEGGDTDADTDTGPGTGTTGTTGTTATGTGTGTTAATGTPTTEPTTTGQTATGTTGQTETGGTDTNMTTATTVTDTGDTEELPPPSDPTCIAYAAHAVECLPRYARYQVAIAQYCEAYKSYGLMTDGQGCLDAIEASFVCLSTVDCAVITMGDPCPAESAAVEAACPNLNDGGIETSGDSSG